MSYFGGHMNISFKIGTYAHMVLGEYAYRWPYKHVLQNVKTISTLKVKIVIKKYCQLALAWLIMPTLPNKTSQQPTKISKVYKSIK